MPLMAGERIEAADNGHPGRVFSLLSRRAAYRQRRKASPYRTLEGSVRPY